MGKKSRRPGRNKPKRSKRETLLSRLNLPFPLDGPDAPRDPRGPRELADFCRKNFLHFDSDKQNEMRFVLFPHYIELVLFEDGVLNSRDSRAMHKIAKDEDDLTYFRVDALSLLACHYYGKFDCEEATACFEKVLKLCMNATQIEKGRQLPEGLSVGEHLSRRKHQAEQQIHKNFNENPITVIRSENEIVQVPLSAGNQCDNCQKTRAELGVDFFPCCSRCQFEYYCSLDCQRSAWKNGHKQQCRAKGDFRPGDQVLEKDGSRIQLVECLEGGNSWVVVDSFGKNQHAVPTKELIRLRPALWRCTKTYKMYSEMSSLGTEQKMEMARDKLVQIAQELVMGLVEPKKGAPEE